MPVNVSIQGMYSKMTLL